MRKCLKSLKSMKKFALKLFTIKNSIIKQPMNLIQKISSHSDAQKDKQNSVLILLWQKINKKTDLNTSLKLVNFIKYKTFFASF